jgi:hypothetical protein
LKADADHGGSKMKTGSVAMALLFAICLTMLGGCGGDQAESPASPAPSPTPSVETRAELEALLKSMALTLEDLPSGFTLDEEKFETNEEAAKDYPDGEEQGLADYARWRRLLGYEASYSTEVSLATLMTGGTIAIQISTVLHEDSEGASEAIARVEERLSDPEQRARLVEEFEKENPNFEDVELDLMSFAQVGDDTAAYQVAGNLRDVGSGTEVAAVYQLVAMRRGRGLGAVMVAAAQGPSPIEELEAMARKLDQRMKEALE